jgi:hypothetical protein
MCKVFHSQQMRLIIPRDLPGLLFVLALIYRTLASKRCLVSFWAGECAKMVAIATQSLV